jgi:hypothetical protein
VIGVGVDVAVGCHTRIWLKIMPNSVAHLGHVVGVVSGIVYDVRPISMAFIPPNCRTSTALVLTNINCLGACKPYTACSHASTQQPTNASGCEFVC